MVRWFSSKTFGIMFETSILKVASSLARATKSVRGENALRSPMAKPALLALMLGASLSLGACGPREPAIEGGTPDMRRLRSEEHTSELQSH